MKRLTLNPATVAIIAMAFLHSGVKLSQQQNNTPLAYMGEIMDETCASKGTHEQMMSEERTKSAKDCALLCVKYGDKLVLYSKEEKSAYNLDDQNKVADYAGEKVSIIGTYDGLTKTIHIQSVTVVP
jgi:hypothetical protein